MTGLAADIIPGLLTTMICAIGAGLIRSTLKLLGEVRDLHDKVEEIQHEVRPNSGTSIKDAVARIEHRIEINAVELSAHRERLEEHLAQGAKDMARVERFMERNP